MVTKVKTRYRQHFHIIPQQGWMNDPNGLCFFKGYYHVFFQYHPDSAEWGPMHWGHVRSVDLVHWERCPIALKPDSAFDDGGCFSGSAVVKDDRLYLMYTGNHYVSGTDHQVIWQDQNIAYSDDGLHFIKYSHNPVIKTPPSDNAADFRDPKLWWDGKQWSVVIGSKSRLGLGRALQYQSDDLLHWTYQGVLDAATASATEGNVWECPNLVELSGRKVLLFSPQGIATDGYRYRNIYQTGYFTSINGNRQLIELDAGHDFYAAQTFIDEHGRHILFAWMDMWEAPLHEQVDGWAGTLTLPRQLDWVDGRLTMTPLPELKALRSSCIVTRRIIGATHLQDLPRALEVVLTSQLATNGTATLMLGDDQSAALIKVIFDRRQQAVTLLKMGARDARRTTLKMRNDQLKLHLYCDYSSCELFINDGAVTFSERIYPQGLLKLTWTPAVSQETELTAYALASAIEGKEQSE